MSQLNGWANVHGCNEWNSFYEEKISKDVTGSGDRKNKVVTPRALNDVIGKDAVRTHTGIGELDRVLGGGLVKGSLVLVGGEPGIGKSTLILQLCDKVQGDGKVLYVSGEESAEQIKLRADRLEIHNDDILFLGETDIELIENSILEIRPKLVIIDSIQTMYSDEISSAAGTVSQVREITARIMRVCKSNEITTIIIGHVTKEGNIAGPRVLEHMVDTVLYLEGERYFSYRILRGVKNRFGSTNEVGMFEMQSEGMVEITNPSSILISEREDNPSGSVIVASMEGTRPLLIELQALTTPTVFGLPRRAANGIDYNRLTLLVAVLEKRAGLALSSQDIYLNVVSGIKIAEPAVDLGTILVCASSFKNISIDKRTVVIGEVGLTGEVRAVNLIDKRLKEAEKLGFKTCIIPENNKKLLKEHYKLDIIGVKNVSEAMKAVGLKWEMWTEKMCPPTDKNVSWRNVPELTRRENELNITEVLKMIAPGTPIRDGLENILKAKTGALIVIGDTKEVLDLVDGGFQLDVDYTSSRLYELAKMDGAIVLSSDLKKILYANTQIIPSPSIVTTETGTRHRTAERTAKQTGALVISISQRRSIITIFKGNYRYVLEDTAKVISKANQALQTVEKYKKVFDNKLSLLNEYEFNDIVTLENVITAIQRAEMVMKIVDEVQKSIYELGEEGRLLEMQLEELIGDLDEEELLIIKDYVAPGKKRTAEKVLEEIKKLAYDELMISERIAKLLGYEDFDSYDEVAVYTRGYRVLNKIPRMPSNIVENLVKSFKSFQHILDADLQQLDDVDGIGEIRARTIKSSLKRMQEQFVFDNLIL